MKVKHSWNEELPLQIRFFPKMMTFHHFFLPRGRKIFCQKMSSFMEFDVTYSHLFFACLFVCLLMRVHQAMYTKVEQEFPP